MPILIQDTPTPAVGLGTWTFTCPYTGTFNVWAQITDIAPGSSLVVTVKQNLTTVYTAPALGQTQTSLQFKEDLLCNSGDVISVILSSSNPADAQLNVIKSLIQVGDGL